MNNAVQQVGSYSTRAYVIQDKHGYAESHSSAPLLGTKLSAVTAVVSTIMTHLHKVNLAEPFVYSLIFVSNRQHVSICLRHRIA